jgi:hypothetical protein
MFQYIKYTITNIVNQHLFNYFIAFFILLGHYFFQFGYQTLFLFSFILTSYIMMILFVNIFLSLHALACAKC